MHRDDKERVIGELTVRLRGSEALIVADYRGLTMPQVDALRERLLEHGARFSVVKNTLTRRAAAEAGVDALLAMLEGPSAIAFIESEGAVVEVAKALSDSARETKVLVIRGGLMQGRTLTAADVEELSKLPPFDVLRGQVLGAVTAPLSAMLGLLRAPLQNLVGLIDARIEQLGGADAEVAVSPAEGSVAEPVDDASAAGGGEPVTDAVEQEPPEQEPVEQEIAVDAEATQADASPNPDTESDNQEVDDGGS
jgi:large subunit ribosomal protein L10